MKLKTINIRDFQRNLRAVIEEIEQGQVFIVLRNGQPVFKASPTVSIIRKIKNNMITSVLK